MSTGNGVTVLPGVLLNEVKHLGSSGMVDARAEILRYAQEYRWVLRNTGVSSGIQLSAREDR
jgi:hypothetical protein